MSTLWCLGWGLEEVNEELEKKAEARGQVTKWPSLQAILWGPVKPYSGVPAAGQDTAASLGVLGDSSGDSIPCPEELKSSWFSPLESLLEIAFNSLLPQKRELKLREVKLLAQDHMPIAQSPPTPTQISPNIPLSCLLSKPQVHCLKQSF